MGELGGFLKYRRETPARRPVAERVGDWREVYLPFPEEAIHEQAARCMNCGTPFCHSACSVANLIPEWNDLVYRGEWREACERLHATINFPEFTGRLCPALCEGSCVLGANDDPVTIRQIEVEIVERGFAHGWVVPRPPSVRTGKRVAVVGSGPAGLAAAQQLTRAGHDVTVFERAPKAGGLLRYGIPEFKLEKRILDRRLDQMREEGTQFRCGVEAGVGVSAEELRRDFDAVLLAGGSTVGRDLNVPGREFGGIHLAMEYLTGANRVAEGSLAEPPITARGKRVVILGGGDTGADCLGTALRQGAASVLQLEILPRPPERRAEDNPWPLYPDVLRTSSAHEEGGERLWCVSTTEFLGDADGRVRGLRGQEVSVSFKNGRPAFEPVPGTEFERPCELVLLALGFVGPQRAGLLERLGVEFDARGTVARKDWATTVDGVFVAGDMGRGQSLIVWAIAEGRSAAAAVDRHLTGEALLPAPLNGSVGR